MVRWGIIAAFLLASVANAQVQYPPIQSGANPPAKCTPATGIGETKLFWSTTQYKFKYCSAIDTWIDLPNGPGPGNASFNWESPTSADSGKWFSHYSIPATIYRVYCSTDTGIADVNFEIRLETAPNTAGDAVLASDLTCTDTGASTSTIQNAEILANRLLTPTVTSTSGSPGVLRMAAIVNPVGSGSAGNASFGWENPGTGDSGKWQAYYSEATTISKVVCSTDAGTVDLNFEIRTENAPNATGTVVLSSALVCTDTGASTLVILNEQIPASRLLTPIITATSGSPGLIRATVVTQ